MVDLGARKTGIGALPARELENQLPIVPRVYLLIPPILFIAMLVSGYAPTSRTI
jgi:TRAP-type uncharacterized transport system fused permease subunit